MGTDKWKERGKKKKKEADKPSFLSKVVRKFSWLANFPFSLYIIKNASHIESCALNHFPLSTEGDLWCSLLHSWRNFNAYFSTVINILKKYRVSKYILSFQSRYITAHFFLISFDFLIVCALPLILPKDFFFFFLRNHILLKVDFIYMLQLMWLALLPCNNLCWIMIEREK